MKLTLVLLLASMGLQAGNSLSISQLKHNGFSISSRSSDSRDINFQIPEYELNDVTEEGNVYKRLTIKDAGTIVEKGQPYLPTVSTLYAVEPGKEYTVNLKIIESEIIRNVDLSAHRGWENGDEDIPVVLNRDQNVYFSNHFPAENAQVSEPMILRDLSLVQVSFTPFIYSPLTRELEVISRASLELVESGTRAADFVPAQRSRAFEPLYQALVVNYDQHMRTVPYQKPSILYVLPANPAPILSLVNMLVDWRKRSGYEVATVSIGSLGSQQNTDIKNYIQNAYNTWANPPEHVTFIGDASGTYSIPTWADTWSYYNGDGDHPYSLLVGTDILPEIFLGRLSITSPTELGTMVSKTIQYESNPYMSENWFERAVLVSDTSPSGISTIITNEYIRMLMENEGYTDFRTMYGDFGTIASQMVTELNDGASFFNYRGYLGVSGFSSSSVNSLTNGFKLPVMTLLTCGTGSFGSSTSLSEACVRAGTASLPKGAVASIGTATTGTHTMFNNCVAMGFYEGVFVEGIETAGAALMRGKLQLYLTYPTNPNNYVEIFSHWNTLIGDSALRMWTAMPERVSVSAPSFITVGTNSIDVQVTSLVGGIPVENAQVTITKGVNEISETRFTNAAGQVSVPVNSLMAGTINLTVAKKNHVPYQGSVVLTNTQQNINVSQQPIVISDDDEGESAGNGDGLLNPGETIECSVLLRNYGSEDVGQVSARLVSSRPAVTIVQDSLFYGDITAGSDSAAAGNFVFSLAPGLTDGMDLGLQIQVSDTAGNEWNHALNLTVSGNQLVISEVVLTAIGGVLNPGQSTDMQLSIQNIGQTDLVNLTGTLASPLNGLEVTDGDGSWGTVASGTLSSNGSDRFSLTADENILPGTVAYLTLRLTADGGYVYNTLLPLTIGEPGIEDPTGPDEYGYYIFDSGDQFYSNAPFFDWIEIDPALGGAGTDTDLSDTGNNQDDVVTLQLPFNFRMYGVNYSEISVCSNGWVAMGSTTMQSFRNYPVPGTAGPSPMIAAFWDDLKTTSSDKVYYWYDEENQQYVIEWSGVKTYYNNDSETFQVILRNPQYYFTPTGDGEILIQYLDFNNTSQTTSSATNHGNYSTIGIEDHTGRVGLQYSFANQWAPSAMPMADSTAILITTKGSLVRLRGDINNDNVLDIFDIIGMIDFILADNPGSINPFLADVNNDGVINILDMISVVQTVMEY